MHKKSPNVIVMNPKLQPKNHSDFNFMLIKCRNLWKPQKAKNVDDSKIEINKENNNDDYTYLF